MARKAKKDPKTAADDAVARSKNKKTAQTVKAPAKASPAVAAATKSPDTDKEAKALFLHHLVGPKGVSGITALKIALNTANANLRNGYKAAKAHGYLKCDFDDAFAIQQADGEKKKKAAIARSLMVAKWLGCDLGSQLDLFVEDTRVPAADRAYEEGQAASMKGETANPEYHPATEQHRQFMAGYHDDQERRVKGGIGKLHPAVAEDLKETAAQQAKVNGQKAEDAKVFEAPASGVAMTRSQHDAMKANRAH